MHPAERPPFSRLERRILLIGVVLAAVNLLLFFLSLVAVRVISPYEAQWLRQDPINAVLSDATKAILLLTMLALYGTLIYLLTKTSPSKRVVTWIIALTVIQTFFLFLSYPIFSSDVADYVSSSRTLTVHWANPYITPADQVDTQAAKYSGWSFSPTAYGPLWTLIATLVSNPAIAPLLQIYLFKALAMLFMGGCAWLLYDVANEYAPTKKYLLLISFLWCPFIQLESIASSHNDMAMVFFLVLGIWLIVKKRHYLAVAAIMCSVLIKYTTAIIVPLVILYGLAQYSGWRAKIFWLIKSLAVIGIICLIAFAPFFDRHMFDGLFERNQYFGPDLLRAGFAGILVYALMSALHLGSFPGLLELNVSMLFAICILIYIVAALRPMTSVRLVGMIITLIGIFLLASPTVVHPWYYLWLVIPLMMLWGMTESISYRNMVIALTCVGLLSYVFANTIATLLSVCVLLLLMALTGGFRKKIPKPVY